MSDQQYFVRIYNGEAREVFQINSDTEYRLTDWFPESKYGKPRPELGLDGFVSEYELSSEYIVITGNSPSLGTARVVHRGSFTFEGKELVGGVISETISIRSSTGEVTGKRFSSPISVKFSDPNSPNPNDSARDPNVPGTSITTTDGFAQFFPAGWGNRPFEDNLVSVASTSGGSGSSSGGSGSSTPQTLTTTTSVDTLTGIKKKKDIFKFDADPSGQVDKVTGFNAKEKDVLSISKSAFEIDRGTFAIAKNAKALAKQLATSVDIVYNRQTGELILNANGPEPGFGEDGGVFAVLVGRPTISSGSVQFY
jgi:hypothetical protein